MGGCSPKGAQEVEQEAGAPGMQGDMGQRGNWIWKISSVLVSVPWSPKIHRDLGNTTLSKP